MLRTSLITIFLAVSAFFGYVGVVLFGPVHMIHMAQMDKPMDHCPFAVGEHTLCSMDFDEHLAIWQSFSNVTPASEVLLLASALLIVFGFYDPIALLAKIRPYILRHGDKTRIHPYQQLFSEGILNPKAP